MTGFTHAMMGHRAECPLVARLSWQVWCCDGLCEGVETCSHPVFDRDGMGCGPCCARRPCAMHDKEHHRGR